MMDAVLGPDGDLLDDTYRALITGDELVRQRLVVRLQRFFGEWFLDETAGIPYEVWIQMKPPDLGLITARIRTEVSDTPGVVSVGDFTAVHNTEVRSVTIEGTFTTAAGTVDALVATGATAESMASNSSPWAILFRSGAIHGAPGGLPNSFAGVTG